MISTPEIVETREQLIAKIHLTIKARECSVVFGPAVTELMSVLAAQGIEPAGPIFSHHLKNPGELFDFEVGVPVSKPIKPAGRVESGNLGPAKVARIMYRGPYAGLHDAWAKLEEWIKENGYRSASTLWECYVTGPESSSDQSEWCTQLNRPLCSG